VNKFPAHQKLAGDYLKARLPEIGEWFRVYMSGKKNENLGFDGAQLDDFIKEGCIGADHDYQNGFTWRMCKAMTGGKYDLTMEFRFGVSKR